MHLGVPKKQLESIDCERKPWRSPGILLLLYCGESKWIGKTLDMARHFGVTHNCAACEIEIKNIRLIIILDH